MYDFSCSSVQYKIVVQVILLTWQWEVLDSVHPVPLGVPGVPIPLAPPMGAPVPAGSEHVTGVTGRSKVIDINNWTRSVSPGIASAPHHCHVSHVCATGLKIEHYQQHYQHKVLILYKCLKHIFCCHVLCKQHRIAGAGPGAGYRLNWSEAL